MTLLPLHLVVNWPVFTILSAGKWTTMPNQWHYSNLKRLQKRQHHHIAAHHCFHCDKNMSNQWEKCNLVHIRTL